ncbi:hypothetical protein [Pedobacter boryungensis]|uniref:DUF4251 domain-containing protein n=1 Tax=Pedobacter boryungensis TaxID=869962 RepID=A0ABX2DGW7_9SPHI|nr:hypothetical protein [Pedobacter boryungensis]NQX33037.1 hypothetical protein [Pedobacter boryungensis]
MKKLIFICAMCIFSACTLKEQEKIATKSYFDLESYFKQEATRLTKANQPISKTVLVNGNAEAKSLLINNWENELSSFIEADINKASWRSSFEVKKTESLTTYTSNSKKIPVKKLEINYKDNKVMAIKILVTNTNDLYTSQDSLSYYPDSLYQIKKTQHIKLMDEKRYQITGKFK